MFGERRFGNAGWRGRMVLEKRQRKLGQQGQRVWGPFRTNITPDQSVGSPGVRLMNTPCGQAYLRLEL